jgi:hypothetical protein
MKVTDEQWKVFGEKCVQYGLSGRSIENMSRKVVTMIEDFDYPLEYFKADAAKKREIIKQFSKPIFFEEIIKLTENYIQFEKEAEEKAAYKRFEDRVIEIRTYLSAEKVAKASLLGIE